MKQGEIEQTKQPRGAGTTKIDTETTLERLEHLLQGVKVYEAWNQAKQDYETVKEDVADALLNDEGVQSVMREIRGRVSDTNIQANTDKDELYKFMRLLHKHIACTLMENYNEWDVESLSDYHQIVNLVSDQTYLALTRTIDDKEREHNTDQTSIVKRFTDQGRSALNKMGFEG